MPARPYLGLSNVSTHSRPKAAATVFPVPVCPVMFQLTAARRRLHVVAVPRGGWRCFNSQPPEGGCAKLGMDTRKAGDVSTHSRPKAAARRRACASPR